ncbi:unnamed protein product [Soboliphyme baturini]|uniref:Metalloprotease TIKI homolog n=1 Tax=Soboliphyme baturini TaxID=241478 RepID=A0A183IMF0_9BILA|nr:unnamed protein product [Soboliphyme baturini]
MTPVGRKSVFLWRIKRKPPSFFFGTIHVPYTEVWDYVNQAAKQAFRRSDSVFFELDLNNPKTLERLAMCQYLPDGERLSDHLPLAMYEQLKAHMAEIRLALPRWISVDDSEPDQSKSYAMHLFDTIAGKHLPQCPRDERLDVKNSIHRRGIPVLDLYLTQEAVMMSKPTGAIETAEEQCEPLNSLKKELVLFALNRSLLSHELSMPMKGTAVSDNSVKTRNLIEHYICGSLDERIFAHDSLQVTQVDKARVFGMNNGEIDDYFRQELIDKRNVRMAERVLKLLESHPDKSFFFAFGAGHFLGKNSVIDLVKQSGFEVRPVIVRPPSKQRQQTPRKNRLKQTRFKENQRHGFPMLQLNGEHGFTPKQTVTPMPAIDQRNFKQLWIRVNGFSPRPWQELQIAAADPPQTVQNYFLVHYHNHFMKSAAVSNKLFNILPLLLCIFLNLVAFFE